MTFEVLILGSSSATPIFNRHPSAQVINIHERFFLIDCGEGTQLRLMDLRVKFHRINHIFISHLHGDHYLGLVGLMSTLHLQGRTEPLHLYAVPALKEIIDIQFLHSQTVLKYELIFHPLGEQGGELILEEDNLKVKTIALNHRIPCVGFLFNEHIAPRKLIIEEVRKAEIPLTFYQNLKAGEDYKNEQGVVVSNSSVTTAARASRSYAYCSDTAYSESVVKVVAGVDLLYHESTFTSEMAERAADTFHSTAQQAGMVAAKANVKQLLIGHFSARYKDLIPMLNEARQEFANTHLAIEGTRFRID